MASALIYANMFSRAEIHKLRYVPRNSFLHAGKDDGKAKIVYEKFPLLPQVWVSSRSSKREYS